MSSDPSANVATSAAAAAEVAREKWFSAEAQGAKKAADAEAKIQDKIAAVKLMIQKKEQKLENFRPDRDNLDWPRRKEVKAGRMSLEEAKKDAKQEVELELQALHAELKKLQTLGTQAASVHRMEAATSLLPDVHENTSMIPALVEAVGQMQGDLKNVVAASQGQLKLEPDTDIDSAIRQIRSQKATLTSQFQAMKDAKKAGSTESAGQVCDDLAAEQAEEEGLKKALALANGEMQNLKDDIKTKKIQIGKDKLFKDEASKKKHEDELSELQNRQTQLKSRIDDLKLKTARPKRKTAKPSSAELKLDLAATTAKETYDKAVTARKEAKNALNTAKLDLHKAEGALKKAKGDDIQAAEQEVEKQKQEVKTLGERHFDSQLHEAHWSKRVRDTAKRLRDFKSGELVQTDLPDSESTDRKVDADRDDDALDESANIESPVSASSAAEGMTGTLKRKAKDMDLTEKPQGATRQEWNGVKRAAQDNAQTTLATNTSAGSGVGAPIDPSAKFPGQRRVEDEDVH